ncbi:MAG: ComEC/Rec2 family competence protein [Candidatus Caenarcaniphilales bacterium]|nr:ComEC/Rec2 family competence protein [Candidatus Caenarcaniphilales bacterium]
MPIRLGLLIGTLFFIFITASLWYQWHWLSWLVAFACLGFYLYRRILLREVKFRLLLVAVLAMILSIGNFSLHIFLSKKPDWKSDHIHMVKVIGLPQDLSFYRYRILVESEIYGRWELILNSEDPIPFPGDRILVQASPRSALSLKTKNFLRSQNIVGILQSRGVKKVLPMKGFSFEGMIARLQIKLTEIYRIALPTQISSILQTFLIGSASPTRMSYEDRQIALNLGLSHIFAPSGQHLALVSIFLIFGLRRLKLPALYQNSALLTLITLYALLAGWTASIARAWFAAVFIVAGQQIGRRVNYLNALGAAILMTLLVDPNAIGDLGLQFSYLSTLGILLFHRKLVSAIPMLPASWLELPVGTISAQLLVLPLQLFYFGSLPLYTLPANLLGVPLASSILLASLVTSLISLLGSIGMLLSSCLCLLLFLLTKLLLVWMMLLHSLPGAVIQLPALPWYLVIWLYLAEFGIIYGWHFHSLRHWLGASGICLSLCAHFTQPPLLKLNIFERKAYTAVLVESPEKTKFLFCLEHGTKKGRLAPDPFLSALTGGDLEASFGKCPLSEGLKPAHRFPLKQENQLKITPSLDLKISPTGALLIFKRLHLLLLTEPVSSSETYSMLILSTKLRAYDQQGLPGAEICLARSEEELPRCKRTFDIATLPQDFRFETDGNSYKLININ